MTDYLGLNYISEVLLQTEQSVVVQIAVTLLILLLGYFLSQGLVALAKKVLDKKEEKVESIKREKTGTPYKYIEYTVSVITILLALFYLNSGATNELFSKVLNYIPSVLTATLIFILGFITVNILVNFLQGFLETFGLKKYARDLGFASQGIDMFFNALKVFLYLVALEIAVTQLGVNTEIIENTIRAASYGLVVVLTVLAFYGFKDLIANYAGHIYLKTSKVVKKGNNVKIDGESGEIRDISTFSTTIATDKGYFMVSPNKNLMDKNILFKRVKADIETLEDIKNYFVAQEPSYCGPASSEMALAMFGYNIGQERIAKVSGTELNKGVMPEDLIESVEQLTRGEVKGAFVEHKNITDLGEEFKTWFNDGALIITNFAKPALFPNATKGHYSLSVGVEGDEVLIIDPSSITGTGGVYYVDKNEMLDAMSEYEGEERGYIVLAPKDTRAYWRIKNELIYSDIGFYEQLSKNLELQLGKIMRSGRILKNVFPDSVDNFMEEWGTEENVRRVWKADSEQGGDKKLDEFTSSDE